MKILIKKILLVFVLFLLGFVKVLPWSKYTHIGLTIKSIEHSEKIKNGLFSKLNIDQGNSAMLRWGDDSKNISRWMEYGADVEDKALALDAFWARSNNHFHNPLKIFDDAGLTDLYIPLPPRTPLSLILWAQNGNEQDYYPEKDFSWAKTREYYYSALTTTTPEPISREEYFARMFKGLGHQIHLIQDSAVPDHVRNDSHWEKDLIGAKKYGSFRCIETWLEDDKNLHLIIPFSQAPLFPQVNLRQVQENNLVPIVNLVDYDVYDGTNPSKNMEQGLSEYTNANFVSEDTILTEGNNPDSLHYFPYPKYASTNLNSLNMPYIITAADGKQDYVTYLKKDKHGKIIEHFLKAGYMERALRPNADQPPTEIYLRTFFLDELCHKDYASMLVPRAVGYSAALINYFFRGEIEVTLPGSDSIYALCVDPAKGFENMSLMVKNITPDNEEMKNGQVSLILSYRLGNGSPFVPNPPFPDLERYYKVYDCTGVTAIPRDNPLRLDVDMSQNPLPVNAVDVTLTVIFKGDLGTELTNAVAIGFKDISEPTPVDLFNNSDKVCFNGNYVNYNDTALWDAVDINPKNGKIDCLYNAEIDITRRQIWPIFMSFNGEPAYSGNYYYQYENGSQILPGETPLRIYVLADAYPSPINLSVFTHTESMDNDDDCSMYLNSVISFDAYTNKLNWINSLIPEERHYEHVHSPIGYFRGFPVWNLGLFENSKVPAGSVCSTLPSATASSSSAPLTKNSLGNPKIIVVTSKMKSK